MIRHIYWLFKKKKGVVWDIRVFSRLRQVMGQYNLAGIHYQPPQTNMRARLYKYTAGMNVFN